MANLKLVWGFGLLFPPVLLLQSKALIGVYMLPLADNKPHVLQRCLNQVVKWHSEGILKPHVGGVFSSEKLAEAHAFLESRKSIGKVIVKW
jgi:NADPH2:quinone reductase